MTCRDYQEKAGVLEDYVGGALATGEARGVASHLEQCELCRARVAEAQQLGTLLRCGYTRASEPSGAFWTRLRANLRDEEQRQQQSASDWWGSIENIAWRLSYGAAALVVLLLGIVIGTHLPSQRAEGPTLQAVERDIFPEPVNATDGNDVLVEMAAGRSRMGR